MILRWNATPEVSFWELHRLWAFREGLSRVSEQGMAGSRLQCSSSCMLCGGVQGNKTGLHGFSITRGSLVFAREGWTCVKCARKGKLQNLQLLHGAILGTDFLLIIALVLFKKGNVMCSGASASLLSKTTDFHWIKAKTSFRTSSSGN